MDSLEMVIQILIAIGTLGAVVAALFADLIKYKVTPSKLKVIGYNLRGEVTKLTDLKTGQFVDDSIYYHLKVVNKKPWQISHNTRVVLISYQKKLQNGDFQDFSLTGEPSFIWTPAEQAPNWINISESQTFDFGRINKKGTEFQPLLTICHNNFQGYVRKNDVIRYKLKIKSDNIYSKEVFIFEVFWDGNWDSDLDKMAKHLIIKEIFDKQK